MQIEMIFCNSAIKQITLIGLLGKTWEKKGVEKYL